MEKEKIISSIAKRGNGEIYLGVVGAVRTGKSTFIKRFIENLVVPNISDEYEKKRCLDEIPQSAQGKTIMTTEPKFVPSNGALIKVGEFETNIKLVDCVGYVIPEANGFVDEDGNPRMVKSPWFEDAIPFVEAAEIGTEKVIKDHATIGIVLTTDGSIGEIKRESYVNAETKVVEELKNIGKPFIIILNSIHPTNTETVELARKLSDDYEVPVMPISAELMNEKEIMEILKTALYEFPVLDIKVSIPEWVHVLPESNEIKSHYLEKIKELKQGFVYNPDYYTDNVKTFSDLNKLPLILQNGESNSRKLLDYIALQKHLKLIPRMEVVSQELISEFTNIGLGVGFVIIDLANRNFKNLKELEINKTIPNINVYLAMNKSISLTFVSKKFIDYL